MNKTPIKHVLRAHDFIPMCFEQSQVAHIHTVHRAFYVFLRLDVTIRSEALETLPNGQTQYQF